MKKSYLNELSWWIISILLMVFVISCRQKEQLEEKPQLPPNYLKELPRLIFDDDEEAVKAYEKNIPRNETMLDLGEMSISELIPGFINSKLSVIKAVTYHIVIDEDNRPAVVVGVVKEKMKELLKQAGYEEEIEEGELFYENHPANLYFFFFEDEALPEVFKKLGCDAVGLFSYTPNEEMNKQKIKRKPF